MNISSAGVALIKQFEGCKLHAYLDIAGIPTIGYGHTAGVRMGDIITQAQADELLAEDLAHFAPAVLRLVDENNLTQYRFDAMVSLAFNIGLGAFERSSVRRFFNEGLHRQAASSFLLFDKVREKGLLVRSDGLARRREAERRFYLGMTK